MPDRYDDTSLGQVPPRREYKAEQTDLNAKTEKKAGGIPAKVQQNAGTESPRVEVETKSASIPGTPSGGKKSWPSGVQSFSDSEV